MSESFEYGRAGGDDDRKALGEVLRRTFHFPADRVPDYFNLAGHENLRVVRERGAIVGGLVVVPMGQYFGGRSVPMMGIAAVGIDQHVRGQGAASALMRGVVREMHAMDCPISTLYPATQPLYQRVGYEQAGTFYRCVLPTAHVDARERDLALRPITDADSPAIEACYQQRARHGNGQLDRGPYVWTRVRTARDNPPRGFLVEGETGVEGYVYVTQKDSPTRSYNLVCSDLVALTQGAARRLLMFFADHRSMAGEVIWNGHPADALHLNIREQHIKDEVKDQWMLRILHVGAAFEARGYGPGISADLHLDVHGDDALAEVNNGRWLVRIADGRAQVQRGAGHGSLRVHVRGLAALYSGMVSPWQAQAAGWLEGGASALASLSVLAGSAPWLADHF